jgi:hypothetical protein
MIPGTWSDLFVGLTPIIILIIFWLIPVLIAFVQLRRHSMEETPQAVWVLIILIVPIIGPITYLILFSKRQNPNKD